MIRHRFENGLHLVLLPASGMSEERIAWGFRTGHRYESPVTAGFSRWWLESATSGTELLPSASQIYGFFEGLGGNLQLLAEPETTGAWCTFPPDRRADALLHLFQWISQPLHRDALEIRRRLSQQPGSPLREAAQKAIFGDHPLGRTAHDRQAALNEAQLHDLFAFADDWIHPENGVLVWQTFLSEGAAVDALGTGLGSWKGSVPEEEPFLRPHESPEEARGFGPTYPIRPPSSPDAPFVFPSRKKGPLVLLRESTSSTCTLEVGFLGDGPGSPHSRPQRLLWESLTQGPTSRLGRCLDRHPEWEAELEPRWSTYTDVALYRLTSQTNAPCAEPLLREIVRELFRVQRSPLEPQEIRRARARLRAFQHDEGSPGRLLAVLHHALLGWDLDTHLDEREIPLAAKELLVEDRMYVAAQASPRVLSEEAIEEIISNPA